MEALKAMSSFFMENNLRSRRNLRSDIEKRSLAINEEFLSAFQAVKEVRTYMRYPNLLNPMCNIREDIHTSVMLFFKNVEWCQSSCFIML